MSGAVDFHHEAIRWEVDVERIEAAVLLLYGVWEMLTDQVYGTVGIVGVVT